MTRPWTPLYTSLYSWRDFQRVVFEIARENRLFHISLATASLFFLEVSLSRQSTRAKFRQLCRLIGYTQGKLLFSFYSLAWVYDLGKSWSSVSQFLWKQFLGRSCHAFYWRITRRYFSRSVFLICISVIQLESEVISGWKYKIARNCHTCMLDYIVI